MKTIFILFLIFSFSSFFAQTLKHDSVQYIQKSRFTEYLASDNYTYKIEDTIQLGNPSSIEIFNFINRTINENFLTLEKAGAEYSGISAVISEIKVKNSICYVKAISKNRLGTIEFILEIEKAIQQNEMIAKGMTSGKAILELKKAKEKLDLELISQAEYDAIKVELAPFIK